MLTPESLYQLQFPSDPQLAQDGKRVAFVLTRVEEEDPKNPDAEHAKPRYKSRLWLADKRGARELTTATGRDHSPRWSPDGERLAFISDRADKVPQLFMLDLVGGEARQLTSFRAGVSGAPLWSPDGTQIAFTSRGDQQDKRAERGQPLITERLAYKANGAGFLNATPDDLYLLNVETGEVKLWHTPPTDLGDLAWWPDGRGLLYIAAPNEQAAAMWKTEVFELLLSGKSKQLTRWQSTLHNLTPHPDSGRFAALGHSADKLNTEDSHVFLFEPGGKKWARLDADWDYPAGNIVAGDCHVGAMTSRPVWLEDGKRLLLSYTVGGSCGLFELGKKGKVHEHLYHSGQVVSAFSVNDQGEASIRESDSVYPEVYLNGKAVTDLGSKLPFTPLAARRIEGAGEAGPVEGWLLRPEGADSLPVTLHIHGGPHTAYGHGFIHEFQLFAARGYAAVYCNPRGSVGYGQGWSEAIYGRWGTVDYQDIMAFYDAALSEGGLDQSRSAVMGGSYGGYMTNWVLGHTDRFQCAITDRSICDLVSFGGTSDIGMRFWDDELGVNFQRSTDVDKLWSMSPLRYVEQVKTPTLIIHSEDDLRCPVSQAEQWFAGLRLHGVPARLVRFPAEHHELSRSGRPDRRVIRLTEYLNWLDAHLQPQKKPQSRARANTQPGQKAATRARRPRAQS